MHARVSLLDLYSNPAPARRSHAHCSGTEPEALWTPLERGLDEWEVLCEQLEDTSTSSSGGEDQDSVHATLRSMARMLARSQQAQALQGRTSTLLARQVVSCMRGTEAETLAKTVQAGNLGKGQE